jgi:chromosome segregation ATPase
MQKQLAEEAKTDEETYDQLACWCETNDKEKTKAIADAEARIDELNIAIEELTAASVRLNKEIKTLEKDVSAHQASLAKATALREKALAEFNEGEKDVLQSISALKSAIVVLSKHHTAALLQGQMSQGQMMQVATTLEHEIEKHKALLQGVLTHKQKKKIAAFIDMHQAPSAGSYAPASGEILGILKQMLESFESDLSQEQKDELQGQSDYENLKSVKEEEIAAGIDQIDTKTQELAMTDEKNAQAKTDLEDTENSLAADQKFLANLKEQCQIIDSEWELRQKTRAEEIEAIGKALEFLTSDEAHDLFTRTFNFVQTGSSSTYSKLREQASNLLAKVARKNNNPKLITLAVQIRLDAFTKVKKAIDEMIAELTKQQADEVKLKEYCRESLNTNLRDTENKNREKKSLEEKIDDLTMTIDELTKSIETLKAEIKEMQFQVKRAGEDREKENLEFQATVADQRATQELLKKALEVLQGFYAKKAAFMQQHNKQTPPTAFKTYQKNENSGGVMSMIQQIINDAKSAEAEAIKAEEDAQKQYESFVKDSNASIEEKTKDIVNKTEEKAKAEQELVKAKETLEKVNTELETLSNEAADLHAECDFVLKNFEIRQTARASEIEALKQVKQILSGAKFSDFLQSNAFVDDGAPDFDKSADSAADSLPTALPDSEHDVLQGYLSDN